MGTKVGSNNNLVNDCRKVLFEFLERYRIETNQTIVNPVDLAKHFKIKVTTVNTTSVDNIGVIVVNSFGKHEIIINSNITQKRFQYVLSYALAYYFTIKEKMVKDGTIYGYITYDCLDCIKDTIEYVYSEFARDMAMPEKLFKEEYSKLDGIKNSFKKLNILSDKFNIDISQVEIRISELAL